MRRVSPLPAAAGLPPVPSQPEAVFIFIFKENEYKYCQISFEAGLAPSGSPAALLPEDSARPSFPGGLFLFIFSENKYCQISSEAGLAPSGSPAALLPEDSARLSCPGGLFLSIFSENKYCLIPPEAGLAPSGSPAALSPLDSAHPSCPGDRFLSIFSENKYCLIPPEAGLAPLGSPAALLPGDSAQPKGFQRPLSFLFYASHKNTAKPYNPPPRCSGSAVGGSIFITPETASAYTACAEKCCRPSAGRSA